MPRTGTFLRTLPPRIVRFACDGFAYFGSAQRIPCIVRNGGVPHREGALRERAQVLLRGLGGGLRSWLAVRSTCTAALYLTVPPSCGRYAGEQGPQAMRGESTRRPVERGTAYRERSRWDFPPRARVLLEAASPGGVSVGGFPFRFGAPLPVPTVLSHGKSVCGVGQP